MANTLITNQRSAGGSYRILRRLGKGGMAEVFLACQEGIAGFRRLAVIKKILPQFSDVGDVADMLLDEARIAAQLTHPNIVQIYELFRDGGQYSIAMEFVDGCDLATLARIERRRQSRIPLRLTLRVVSEAAMGLDYAHRQTGLDGRPLTVVHRDMSPHNIMCSRDGAVKITDFGIAKAVGKVLVTQVGVVKGKVQYMSPEQYTGGDVDNRSDIFSLGVVLYQLTTGMLPRVAKDSSLAMRRIVEGQVPRPSELRPDYPEELEGIVMRSLALNPNERYPDAASLREDLLEFARDNDLLAFPRELGDYINALVPPQPVVVRELSTIGDRSSSSAQTAEEGPPRASAVQMISGVGPVELPSVMVEGEEADTSPPPGTEVASPGAMQRDSIVTDHRSDPFGRTEIPIAASDPACLTDEQLTPLPRTNSDLLPSPHVGHPHLHRPTPAEPPTARRPPEERLPARRPGPGQQRHGGRSDSSEEPPSPSASAPRKRTIAWIVGAAALAMLASTATALYVMRDRGPDAERGVKRKPPPIGAGGIDVLAEPSKAQVSVDGARRCPSTPCHIAGLPLNRELLLTVRAQGYNLWMQRLVLTEREPKLLLRADLTPSSREVATSRGRDRPTRETTKDRRPLPERKQGGQGRSSSSRKQSSPKAERQVVTTDIEDDRSLLAVDVRPWAEVWVDRKKMGHTPIQLPLEPGARKVELKNPELKYSKTFRVRARKGKKVKISVALHPPEGATPPE